MADVDGLTPLLRAASNGHGHVIAALIERRADVEHASVTSGDTALMLACRFGHEEAVWTLLGLGASAERVKQDGTTTLITACHSGRVGIIQQLLEHSASPEQADADGATPLHHACRHGHEVAVRLLTQQHASASAIDSKGRTPLGMAAMGGHETAAAVVLAAPGADAEHRDLQGHTPLMLSAAEGHEYMVGILLKHKVNPDAQAADGSTAALLAIERRHERVVDLLRRSGANFNLHRADGESALTRAAALGLNTSGGNDRNVLPDKLGKTLLAVGAVTRLQSRARSRGVLTKGSPSSHRAARQTLAEEALTRRWSQG